jgi:16S rRNA (cytosine967-C5)-methyltransferase
LRIPDHAVVTETVDAARVLKKPKLAGLVNACLRRCLRESLPITHPKDEELAWNHPQWLIDMLRLDWPEDWQAILSANDKRAPMWLRANASRLCAAQYQQRLRDAGIESECLPGVPDAVCLNAPRAVDDLPGFRDGDVSVQDGAAQIAARWLLHDGGERVLDACAAPGGKTLHLLELAGDELDLVAIDNDLDRSASIRENLERAGRAATILVGDASKPEQWWDGRVFDRILLDAPCSASGVIRRHPDIKLLRRKSDIRRLAKQQASLLRALWPLLAPGGRLVYVTCSVFAVENDAVIEQFLDDQEDAVETAVLPNNNIHDLMRSKVRGYQVLPGTAGLDGFYFACLEKSSLQHRTPGSVIEDPVKVSR